MKDVKNNLINQSLLEKKLKDYKEAAKDSSQIFLKWHNETRNERKIQANFLNDIFGNILGYEFETDKEEYNLDYEQTTDKSRKPVDGVLGFFTKESRKIKVIIELKGKDTKNINTIEQQAFDYLKEFSDVDYIITSNTETIRLYSKKHMSVKYIEWTMEELAENIEKQKEFQFFLSKDRLFVKDGLSEVAKLIEENIKEEKEIKDKFYKEYKEKRVKLINEIKALNSNIDAISKAQKLLDRMLFIRFCIDRGYITQNIVKTVENLIKLRFTFYQALKVLFETIDKGSGDEVANDYEKIIAWNGGLFAEDKELNDLQIGSEILKEIDSFFKSYNFSSQVDVHILGHIFEQSISDIEKLKEGDEFDAKQSKRKKDGVFYTPEYITQYIVEEAVGGWLNDRKNELQESELPTFDEEELKNKPTKATKEKAQKHFDFWKNYAEKLASIKILDPACGSGAFLVEVFNYLENEWQVVNEKINYFAKILGTGSLFEINHSYKDTLKNNIYGVDINFESVQITRLSLWIQTAHNKTALVALDENIKCGNSLIDDPEIDQKAFKWEEEFPFKFDVVVGNPPYVFARGGNFSDTTKEYYYKNYKFTDYQINTYLLFIEQGCNLLNNGRLGFIIPNNWLTINTFANLRKFVLEQTANTVIINTFGDVFEGASVDSCILTFAKDKAGQEITLGKMTDGKIEAVICNKNEIAIGGDKVININQASNKNGFDIIKKINENSVELGTICSVLTGVKCYQTGKGEPKQNDDIKNSRAYHSKEKQNDTYIKYLEGSDVSRYSLTWSGEYLSYGKWIAEPRFSAKFKDERILVRQIPSKLPYAINAVLTKEEFINDINSMIIQDLKVNPMFVLAILNCKLTSFWFDITFNKFSRTIFPQFKINELRRFPIPNIPSEAQTPLITHAQKMLDLTREFNEKRTAFIDYFRGKFALQKITRNLESWHTLEFADFIKELGKQKVSFSSTDEFDFKPLFDREKKACVDLQIQITKTDAEIDKMVYKLYGLSEEEIGVVEGLVV